MSSDRQSTQTPAERRAAEAELRAMVSRLAPEHQRLVASIRRALRKRMPTAYEIAYEYRDAVVLSFAPSDRGYEGVLGVHASADGVKLYFNRGKDISDPDKLLGDTGKQVRSMDVDSTRMLSRPAVVRLIDEALALNTVAFPKGGKGCVVIRETTAKKRSTRRTK